MYNALKQVGISNREAANVLLNTELVLGGKPIYSRLHDYPWLSRECVHVTPGKRNANEFQDFATSAHILLNKALENLKTKWRPKPKTAEESAGILTNLLADKWAKPMEGALLNYHIDASMYRNALSQMSDLELETRREYALLHLILFIAIGCTADPYIGYKAIQDYASSRMNASFHTEIGNPDDIQDDSPQAISFVLIRCNADGMMKNIHSIYPVAEGELGTEIGMAPSSPFPIADVDKGVSRRHARVFRQGQNWYVEGLGSTNGTWVIRQGDESARVEIEPPKRERPRSWESKPYEIQRGDVIDLGHFTYFRLDSMLNG